MNALVVYDSEYGNTEKIAQVIAETLGGEGSGVRLSRVNAVLPGAVSGLDMIVVGSPTQKWNTTDATTRFLESIPENGLREVRAAAFDTRLRQRLGGAAALKIERLLKQSGSRIIAPAGAFYVTEKAGPLAKGELYRATEWARGLVAKS